MKQNNTYCYYFTDTTFSKRQNSSDGKQINSCQASEWQECDQKGDSIRDYFGGEVFCTLGAGGYTNLYIC